MQEIKDYWIYLLAKMQYMIAMAGLAKLRQVNLNNFGDAYPNRQTSGPDPNIKLTRPHPYFC